MPIPLGSPARPLDVALVAAIAVVLVAPVARSIARRRFDPFEPAVLFALAYGAMFVLRPAAMIFSDDLVHFTPLRAVDVSDTFTEMLVLALLGAAAFLLGYIAPIGHRLARSREPRDEPLAAKRAAVASVAFALLGVATFAAFLAWSGGLATLALMFKGGSSELRESVAGFPAYFWHGFLVLLPASLVVLLLAWRTGSRILFLLFGFLASIVLLRALPLGSRMLLVCFLGGLFVLYYVSRSKRPSVPLVLGLAILALLASTVLREARGRETRGETLVESFTAVTQPRRVFDPVVHGTDTEMAPALAAALKVIPEELPQRYGGVIATDFVVRPVPRALWDDKPLSPREELISHLWSAEYHQYHLNTEFSALLFFYWDFGVLGIVFGLALYGLGARVLYEYFLLNKNNVFTQVFFSLAIWLLWIGARNSPVDTFVWALFLLGPVVAISYVAARRPAVYVQHSPGHQPRGAGPPA